MTGLGLPHFATDVTQMIKTNHSHRKDTEGTEKIYLCFFRVLRVSAVSL